MKRNLWSFLRMTRSISERIWFVILGSVIRGRKRVKPDPSAPRFADRNWGTVAVVGRSESASELVKSQEAFDVIILCNFRDTDLQDPRFVKYLAEARAVYVIACIEEPVFSLRISRLIPLAEVLWLGFLDGRMPERKRARGKLSKFGLPIRGLPRDFDERWLQKFGKNTGLTAIRLASLRSRDVQIFGIEFYQTNFLTLTDYDTKGLGFTSPEYGFAIKTQFEELVGENSQVHFSIHCSALGIRELPNLSVRVSNLDRDRARKN